MIQLILSRPHEYPLLRLGVAPLSDAEHPPFQMLDHGGGAAFYLMVIAGMMLNSCSIKNAHTYAVKISK